MRYVIVDLDGASRDYFDTPEALRSALREAEADAPGAAAELYAVVYDAHGERLFDPVRGDEWLNMGPVETGASDSVQTHQVEPPRAGKLTAGASTRPPAVPA